MDLEGPGRGFMTHYTVEIVTRHDLTGVAY